MQMDNNFPTLHLINRLKRSLDRLTLDTHKVYQQVGSKFEPRWFPIFMYLHDQGPSAVKDIAHGLGVTHPAVTQIANELTSKGLVATYRDTKDRRKRVLALTVQGKQIYAETEPLWRQLDRAIHDLIRAVSPDLNTLIDTLPQFGTSIKRPIWDIHQKHS